MLEKRKALIINALYCFIWAAGIILVIKYGIMLVLPFIIALCISFLLKPVINFFTKYARLPRKTAALLSVLLFYSTVGVLIALGLLKIFSIFRELVYFMPDIYNKSIEPAIVAGFANFDQLLSLLPDTGQDGSTLALKLTESLGGLISSLSSSALSTLSSWAASVPQFAAGVLFTVISTFFIATDYPAITEFVLRQLSPKAKTLVYEIKDYTFGTLLNYIKSYLMIITITFSELSIGLSVIGIENAITIALIIAIFDILPVLGTGGIMIPWALIEAIKGNYRLAAALLLIYVAVTVIRNFIEPKIIGEQVGLHPIATLMSIFVGVKLLGPLGIFILPITVVILKKLNDTGRIHIFK